MYIIFLGGLNGAGKTSILNEVAIQRPEIKVIHGSEALMTELGINPTNYDSLRATPDNISEMALTALLKRLKDDSDNNKAIFTGHYVKILDGHITPSLGEWYSHCSLLVNITSSPSIILKRIMWDETSKKRTNRRIFKEDQNIEGKQSLLNEAQVISKLVCAKSSDSFKIPYIELENKEGLLKECVNSFLTIIDRN